MKLCLAGEGAFGKKHLDALARIPNTQVISLAGGVQADTEKLAAEHGIDHCTTDLDESLAMPEVDAVILATPTPLHAQQAIQVLNAGKHVLVEIPMADNLSDAQDLVALQQKTNLVAMVGHMRRFNPSHQWINQRLRSGELKLQQLDVQTYFFRRTNTNALGEPRSWTDNLLWHHACHTVDLFQYQTGELASDTHAMQGPKHPDLGIAMDMSIALKVASGALCTLSLSFNNDGPLGTFFRYICDNGTYLARYDELFDGRGNQIDLSGVDVCLDGIELCDREFIAAIEAGREPNASVSQCLPAMATLDKLEKQMII